MPKKPPKRIYDMDACVELTYNELLKGISVSRIKEHCHKQFNMPTDDFIKIKARVVDRIKERTDIYEANAKAIQIERLDALLETCIEQEDTQMALKVIAELNKVLGVNEQKINVSQTTYKLDI